MREVTFKEFAQLAKRRGHTVDSLTDLFRGKIEDAREFFERVLSCRYKGEDRSNAVIPYRSVIEFYRQDCHFFMDLNPKQRLCACGCSQPVFDRKKWAKPGCRKRTQQQESETVIFASASVSFIDVKVGQKQPMATLPLTERFEANFQAVGQAGRVRGSVYHWRICRHGRGGRRRSDNNSAAALHGRIAWLLRGTIFLVFRVGFLPNDEGSAQTGLNLPVRQMPRLNGDQGQSCNATRYCCFKFLHGGSVT